MFCHNCGAKAHGSFCHQCGAKLVGGGEVEAPRDWSQEVRYEVLMSVPEVRASVAAHGSQGEKPMSGEEFLKLCDKALKPLLGGVPVAKIATLAQPIYARMGIKTGQTRRESFHVPAGRALVAALCSLARRGQSLKGVEQGADGCMLRAELPSDMWSFAGELLVTVERQGAGSSVEAATVIKGQLYDWGKSKRALAALFDDIRGLSA
jgi:hypothetical protein